MATPIAEDEITRFVVAWYRALDLHASIEDCAQLLADSGLEMVFPEKTLHGIDDFRAWYAGGKFLDGTTARGVINIYFDETHTVHTIEPRISGQEAVVDVSVGWQASWWEQPAAKSKRTSLDSTQQWIVRRSSKNVHRLEIVNYIAKAKDLKYAPGFARL